MAIYDENSSVYSYVGQRIRERRKVLKLSQSQLADMLGVSYQQVQKYESGTTHISVGKLLSLAKVLNVPPLFFYEGVKLEDGIGHGIPSDVIPMARTKPLQVLLVEDNPADVILFRKALTACSEQVDVHTIHDSEILADYLKNHAVKYGRESPDLIMLDLSLPKITGLQLLKTIKSQHDTATLPVVVMTNSISKKEMVDAYQLGAAGFIHKSMDIEQYMNSVEVTMRYWAKTVTLPLM